MSLPGFIPQDTKDMSGMIAAAIGMGGAFILAFILTYILRFDDPVEETAIVKPEAPIATKTKERMVLVSPLEGKVVPLAEVPDQVFASGALGKGVAVEPSVGKLFAPADGTITTLFLTGHAVGLTTTDGAEILMHIGMDTVSLDGEGFEAAIKQGDTVKKGDLLVSFDIEKIKAAGLPVITPVVVTNTNEYLDVLDMEQTDVLPGEDFLTIVPN